MKKFLAILVVMSMTLSLVACGTVSTTTSNATTSVAATTNGTTSKATESKATTPKGTILIGMTTPLTGAYAAGGLRASQGAQLAVKEINAKGGVLGGYTLKLQIEDDQGNSDQAVQMVNKLSSAGAAVLMGPYFSGQTIAIANTLTANGIATINGSTAATVRKLNNPWIFRARATDDINIQIIAKAVLDGGAKKVAILCTNDEVGTAAANLYEEYFKKAGVPYYREGHNPTDLDMSSTLKKSVSEKCDAYVMSTHDNSVSVIARQMFELGIKAPVYTNPIIAQAQVLALMEKEWVEGWKCVSDFSYTDTRPYQAAFTKKFFDEYKVNPDIMAALYFGFVEVIADSINRAGSTEKKAIRDAMAKTENLQVPVGVVHATRDEFTNMMFEISLAEIKNLEPVIIKTISLIN